MGAWVRKLTGVFVAMVAPGLSAAAEIDCRAPAGVCERPAADRFAVIQDGAPARVIVDPDEHAAIIRAANSLAADLERIGGRAGGVAETTEGLQTAIIVGSADGSDLIRSLVAAGKIDLAGVEGVWEGYLQQVVENPAPGVERALVIAGADKRGTIFGMYDLIRRAGVSPWEWWADVPVDQRRALYVSPGRRVDAPAVKYRGIFLNDENPALYGFVHKTFDGFNADFYERVFELILRLKGNYLWPAMWGKAFYDDDPENPKRAAEFGIVMGTSHHEPLMRAHVEWARYGEGPWDYTKNAETLRRFWRESMERVGDEDVMVTVGMRGDGDEAMTEGTAIELLETVVADQRDIIAKTTGEPPSETPQIWALYKEVQDYYDQGMEVPDDVTLLFADDNWGNIRRLPKLGSEPREGGYGVYYHFDYVGGPRNYKWINTTQIERVWEQMSLAKARGADEMWIVNVGDLKPMELPISFFLDFAWRPASWPLERLPEYTTDWAEEQFGPTRADEIADILDLYTKYNARRKHELLTADTYGLVDGEWAQVIADWDALVERTEAVRMAMHARYMDAFMQLVWHPVNASANVNRLYHATALNRLYADQGRPETNALADAAKAAYARDAEITRIYHEDIADGKWDHMMSQTHIGYTYWQQPEQQTAPALRRIEPAGGPRLGVSVTGDRRAWPGAQGAPALPRLDPYNAEDARIILFDRGVGGFDFEAVPGAPWLRLSATSGRVETSLEIAVSVDWDAAPAGARAAPIRIQSPEMDAVTVMAPIMKPTAAPEGFVDAGPAIIMEAASACRIDAETARWRTIPNLGRTGSALTIFPQAAERLPAGAGPQLAFDFTALEAGEVVVEAVLSPSLDVNGADGLKFAVAIDDGEPEILTLSMPAESATWNRAVADNSVRLATSARSLSQGQHTLSVWAMDAGVVFQKFLVRRPLAETGYLGGPESVRVGAAECE